MRLHKLAVYLAFMLLASFLFAALANRPIEVGGGIKPYQIQSLSFAPYRRGFSPLEGKFPPQKHLEEDLRTVSQYVNQIRTYTSGEGFEQSHELAAQLGLTYLQGAWLTYNQSDEGKQFNQSEVQRLIQAANTHPEVVKKVVVGNEVLLRGDMPIADLLGYLRTVKEAVKQPVTYADVWSEYLKHPELFEAVDFITIHVLPYWEDEPVSAENAATHLAEVMAKVREQADQLAPGKPILIGETGWPSHGRQRGDALPSPANQALYTRAVVQMAIEQGWQYNLVEAFNQPWKSQLEGVVGANWGLWNESRELVTPFEGAVQNNPNWQMQWAIGAAFVLLFVAVGVRALQILPAKAGFVALLGATLVGQALAGYGQYLWQVSFNDKQLLQHGFHLFFALCLVCLTSVAVINRLCSSNQSTAAWSNQVLFIFYIFYWFVAVWQSFSLATSGRYLSFPLELGYLVGLSYLWLGGSSSNGFSLRSFALPRVFNFQSPRWLLLGMGVLTFAAAMAVLAGEFKAFYYARDLITAHPQLADRIMASFTQLTSNGQLVSWVVLLLFVVGVVTTKRHKT